MDGYLGRVSKALICEAVIEAKGKAATDNIATLKKGYMADRAAEPLTGTGTGTGTGWLPAMLRARIAARQTIPAPALYRAGDRAQRQPRRTTPARLIALWHSGEAKIAACSLRSATVPTGVALRLVAAPRIFVRPSSLLHRSRATRTRQGFDTAIGMRPISSPDAWVIEIQNPSRLPSYAISCARAAPRAAASSFVGNSIPSSSL
jgi:hypothetical protein